MLRINGRESSIVYRSEENLNRGTKNEVKMKNKTHDQKSFLVSNLLSILPLGVWSKNCIGAFISLQINALWIRTAAFSPPNANENALPKVNIELMMQKIQRTICKISSNYTR